MGEPGRAGDYVVLGHVEWVTFARVGRLPASGDIATALAHWSEPAGGGAVAAVQLLRLAGRARLFTVLGEDELGALALEKLRSMGLRVHAARCKEPQAAAFTFVEASHERTITVLGRNRVPRVADPLPWHQLTGAKGVYFAKGDVAALRRARAAKVLVATARVLATLQKARVRLDALVHSARDEGERYRPGQLAVEPRLVVSTEGSRGGTWRLDTGQTGRYRAVPLQKPRVDSYGAGDSFAAGLTFALGEGLPLAKALSLAARCGAQAVQRRGAHGTAR